MAMLFLISFLVSTFLALLLTPVVIRFANRIKALDFPDARKVHKHPIPRLGGLAIFLSVVSTILILLSSGKLAAIDTNVFLSLAPSLLIGSLLMLGVGIADDIRPLRAVTKLAVQIVAAAVVVTGGLRMTMISNPFGAGSIALGWLGAPLTVLWIVAVTNATNLIDGLDGLASGIGAIACLTIAMFALESDNFVPAAIAFALAGGLVGFLRFNSYPARIFLGDSGSLFLGFSLACLSVVGSAKGSTAFAFAVPILSMGVPLLDTTLAIVRRSARALNPKADDLKFSVRYLISHIARPDKEHIHHRLLALGIPHKQAVLMLYGVSFTLGFGALAIGAAGSTTISFFAITTSVVAMVGLWRLDRGLLATLRNNFLIPAARWRGLESVTFQAASDLGFILSACFLANIMGGTTRLFHPVFSLLIVALVQMTTFIAFGTYKAAVHAPGIGDGLRLVKTAAIAAAGAGMILLASGVPVSAKWAVITILDFFILSTLLLASRTVISALRRLSTNEGQELHMVLIYGTGAKGSALLKLLSHSKEKRYVPVGFLDDNPQLEGKIFHGYRIFGGQWKIERLVQKYGVKEIILADDKLTHETLKRIRAAVRLTNIKARSLSVRLQPTRVYHTTRAEAEQKLEVEKVQ